MTQTAIQKAAEEAILSRELTEFLIEFAIGVHRYAMYPQGHPSHNPVLENVLRHLDELFAVRPNLSIGVASRQLVIEGVTTDAKHPVLSDLAKRLHGHQLGAISLQVGAKPTEVAQLLELLAEESARSGTPIGLRGPDELPSWDHVHVHRIGYEQLELKDHADGKVSGELDRASALWLGLAQAAIATDGAAAGSADAATVARNIEGHGRDEAYDQVVVGYMLQLTEELKRAEGEESEKVRERVSKLMTELDAKTLQRLVGFSGNAAQRKRFLLDANQSLAVDSVLKVVSAAAATSEQTISSSMTRMLSKLAIHAGAAGTARSHADTALRENVDALIQGWELKDPNPEQYTTVLDAMATSVPVFQTPDQSDEITGAVRLVQMALEVDAFGPTISKAVDDLIEQGGAGGILQMVRECPDGNEVGSRIRKRLTSPEEFQRLLSAGQIDLQGLRALADEMGSAAIDPLLDVLAETDSRAVRRHIFDVLRRLGRFVAERAIERLNDNRWFVITNMLTLLQRLEHVPEDFDPTPFLEHEDHRVRREALPIAMRPGSRQRDRSVVIALESEDERMVRMALLQIQDTVPDILLPTLVDRVIGSDKRSAEIRELAILCLERSDRPLARTTLLEIAAGRKTLFGKVRLSAKSALSLEALRILASKWSDKQEVAEVLELASKSKDQYIRDAARVVKDGP